MNAVDKIKEYIASGEAIQVVLSQRMQMEINVPPFEIYRVLRSVNPSPYTFFLNFKDFQIVGASPEILVRVENEVVTTRPLAGTRPRGKSALEDSLLEQELLNDEKERAEHIMLVDLARNDIGRVSEPGSIKVSELMTVEKYSHVMHLVTHVQGKLKRSMNMFDALRACFPCRNRFRCTKNKSNANYSRTGTGKNVDLMPAQSVIYLSRAIWIWQFQFVL